MPIHWKAILCVMCVSVTAQLMGEQAAEPDPRAEAEAGLLKKFDAVADSVKGLENADARRAAEARLNAASMLLNCAKEARANALLADADLLLAAAERFAKQAENAASKAPQHTESLFLIQEGAYLGLVNERMGLLFKVTDRLAELKAIYHGPKHHQFLRWSYGARPLWQIAYYANREYVSRLSSIRPMEVTSSTQTDKTVPGVSLTIQWVNEQPRTTIRMTVRLLAGASRSEWRLEVDNKDKTGIGQIEFPIIRGIGTEDAANKERDYLAVPNKSGQLFYRPGKNANVHEQLPMQFIAYYTERKAGMLISPEDPAGVTKYVSAMADSGTVAASFKYPVPWMGVPRKSYTHQGVVMLYEGDWYDAALLYKGWALRQKWAPQEPLHRRQDVPEWLKKCSVSLRGEGDPNREAVNALSLRKEFGLPALLSYYFHFEAENACATIPDFKMLPGFKEACGRMKEAGVMPIGYACPQVFDERNPSFKEQRMARAAVRGEDGQFVYCRYLNNPLVLMDMSHPAFQDYLTKVVVSQVKEHGIKGIYADLVGTYTNEPDFSPNKAHPIGDGSWHWDGTRELCQRIRQEARKIDPDFIVKAENWDERILKAIDTSFQLMGFEKESVRNIPLFQVVYGEFIRPYGSKPLDYREPPLEAHNIAQAFTWGWMIGRTHCSDAAGNPQTARPEYLYFARYRDAALPWLGLGQMLRPLALRYMSPIRQVGHFVEDDWAVFTATYRSPDGRVGFVFTSSLLRDKAEFTAELDPAEYGIPADGSWRLMELSQDGTIRPRSPIGGKVILEESLDPVRAKILVAEPASGR